MKSKPPMSCIRVLLMFRIINPCTARSVYIWFKVQIRLKFVKYFVVNVQLMK